ncbi:MAG: glutathione S-transferase family protein [Burkholderiales bacterium]|jgi:glutathione S-transferase|nr:glutathione S-transferase family protein [Burkholderiales bacterium]MBP6250062.1 glutathione S-transferase family protein [Leptothrix sp. (in: b-proteobacteria)]MBP7520687.1 glutathione S-transferase family protein [Leptothrix sp. (in: b-proteobacteria)]HQY10474.1 glutathione S-transferase family protein [Burkholderiaceae bacterium]
MQLVISPRAPNPRRVRMFIAEKGSALPDIAFEAIDLGRGDHRSAEFKALNPLSRVPVLRLDDGRALAETRAICTYLEGLAPEPNLMGHTFEERAFIEMADRRMEISLLATIANWIRHGHPGLANLEQPQFPDFSASQGQKMRGLTAWLDGELARQPYVAGERFTIADITAFCGLEFARGLMKYRPGDEGLQHLQAWRDRIAERPSAQAGA